MSPLSEMARAPPIVAKTQSQSADPTTRSFLKLPAEILNRIYEKMFHLDGPIYLVGGTQFDPNSRSVRADPGMGVSLALLASCRQIRTEAGGMSYSRNEFVVAGFDDRCRSPHTRKSLDGHMD